MREYAVSHKNNFIFRCFFCWLPYSPGANDAKEVFEVSVVGNSSYISQQPLLKKTAYTLKHCPNSFKRAS